MKRIVVLTLFCFFIFTSIVYCDAPELSVRQGIPGPKVISKADRVLILAPHPDDETIGCAGVIQYALKQGAKVKVAYLTNGDSNEFAFIVYEKRLTLRKGEFLHMGEVRRQEAIKAMQLLGLSKEDLIFLGYPDFGTFKIFCRHWQDSKPYKSLFTRTTSVPYKDSLSYGAPYKGESILSDLEKILIDYQPTKIFVSHPADVNVDHKALYVFLEVALLNLEQRIPKPKTYPYLIHCTLWPKPRGYHPKLMLEPPEKFLDAEIGWTKFELNQEQLDKKHLATLSYKSQTEYSGAYLFSFCRRNELFGDYPYIKLAKQTSLKEKVVAFLGLSRMFSSLELDESLLEDNFSGNNGQVSYAIIDNFLLIRIEKPEELNRRFTTLIYLFGYSYKRQFSSMPKIQIITKFNTFKIFNGKKLIKPEGALLELSADKMIFKLPLESLGNPDIILTSTRAYCGKEERKTVSIDTTAFRVIKIR